LYDSYHGWAGVNRTPSDYQMWIEASRRYLQDRCHWFAWGYEAIVEDVFANMMKFVKINLETKKECKDYAMT